MANTIKKSQIAALNLAQQALKDSAEFHLSCTITSATPELRKDHKAQAKKEAKAAQVVADIIELITSDIFQVVEG